MNEGKWSTNMATMDQAVGVDGQVASVTVALSSSPSSESDWDPNWELHVYDKGSGSSFTLRQKASFVVNRSVRTPQTIALASPVPVQANQRLGVFCRAKNIFLKCKRNEGGSQKWWYKSSAPELNASMVLSSWSGRIGFSAMVRTGGGGAAGGGGGVTVGSVEWDSANLGPDIQLYNNGRGVTRTNSSGWGMQFGSTRLALGFSLPLLLCGTNFTSMLYGLSYLCVCLEACCCLFVVVCGRWSSGVHEVEVKVEANQSNYMYIGVVNDSWSANSVAFNKSNGWSMQADGYVYDNGSGRSLGSSNQLRSGDRVKLVLDVGTKKLRILRNGTEAAQMNVTGSRFRLAICFGGSDQKCCIEGACAECGGDKWWWFCLR